MKYILILALAFIALSSCKAQGGCGCPQTYIPFCGTDEVTYRNKCELECTQRFKSGKLFINLNCPGNANFMVNVWILGLGVKFEGVCAVPYKPDVPRSKPSNGLVSQRPVKVYPPQPGDDPYITSGSSF